MTDSIGPPHRALETLRRQIAERARQLDAGNRPGAPRAERARQPATGRVDIAALRQRVMERVAAIDPADPNPARRQRRIFLESVLAWEFGEALLLDPSFQGLIDRLEDSIAEQPELAHQFDQVLGRR